MRSVGSGVPYWGLQESGQHPGDWCPREQRGSCIPSGLIKPAPWSGPFRGGGGGVDKRAAHLFSLDSNPEIILWLLQDLKQIKFERAERAALNGWLCGEMWVFAPGNGFTERQHALAMAAGVATVRDRDVGLVGQLLLPCCLWTELLLSGL